MSEPANIGRQALPAWAFNAVRVHNDVRTGDIVVSVEIGRQWVEVIRTPYDGTGVLSHIAEPAGIARAVMRARSG